MFHFHILLHSPSFTFQVQNWPLLSLLHCIACIAMMGCFSFMPLNNAYCHGTVSLLCFGCSQSSFFTYGWSLGHMPNRACQHLSSGGLVRRPKWIQHNHGPLPIIFVSIPILQGLQPPNLSEFVQIYQNSSLFKIV